MKITIQDLTVFGVAIVASATLYSIGHSMGIANEVGYQYMPWLLPTSVYDVATTALRQPVYLALILVGTKELFSVGNSRFFKKNPQRFFAVVMLILMFGVGLALLISYNHSILEFGLYALIAILLAAIITDQFQQGHVLALVAGIFLCMATLGVINGIRQTQIALTAEERFYVATTDRNYVNVRIVHSAVSGLVLKSGSEISFYPIDKIIRISRETN